MILNEYPHLIDGSTCKNIIEMASKRLEEAKTVGEDIEGYRVAENCWLGDVDNPYLEWIKDFISKVTELPIDNQEHIHIVKYNIGGEYKEHTDWFDNNDDIHLKELTPSGNRTHSFLIYLNDEFEGGETEFPILKRKIVPEKGKGVMWLNMLDGDCLEETLHAGLPVTKGEKWILIVWVRENSTLPRPKVI